MSIIIELAKKHDANIKEICKMLLFENFKRPAEENELSKFTLIESLEIKKEGAIIKNELHYDHVHLGNVYLMRHEGEFETLFIPLHEIIKP